MSKDDWPGNTAPPPPNGLFWVVRGTRSSEAAWQYLQAPERPENSPWWMSDPTKAGIWSQPDAKLLAELHTDRAARVHIANGERGKAPEVWAEWIGPPERSA
jgi:hypothetical protein